MIFKPQQYKIEDRKELPFIDPQEIRELLALTQDSSVDDAISKALQRERLTLKEVATLLNASEEQRPKVLSAAKQLKQEIYGKRIVLFAPLYVGNSCTNRCSYCSFRADNKETTRKTLSETELTSEVIALENAGHKRLILVFGEHPIYSAEYIAKTVEKVYGIRSGNGEIRRININAAPFSTEEFRTIHASGIGTYQIFQETYDPEVYSKYHLGGQKANYQWRLTSLDRAMEAGIDDVGIGALLGLGDWRFEIMGLIRHTNHLEACYGVGPHTISFPRITEALGGSGAEKPVSDDDFIYAISVLRLAVPYAGLILTARESEAVRTKAIEYGVSQIDGGTKLEIGSYSATNDEGTSQFAINDNRSLAEIIDNLISGDFIPSFCTACYRKGRTGEHFMEFSTKGFIKRFCTPNALLTLAEYLEDYASEEIKHQGWAKIREYAEPLEQPELMKRLDEVKNGKRDLYF